MSNRWIPRWKVVELIYADRSVEVCYDESTRLYACPLCSPVCKENGVPDYGSYFTNQEDLKFHLEAHLNERWRKVKRVKSEEGEEQEGEDED
jgi:hypothetical protein